MQYCILHINAVVCHPRQSNVSFFLDFGDLIGVCLPSTVLEGSADSSSYSTGYSKETWKSTLHSISLGFFFYFF